MTLTPEQIKAMRDGDTAQAHATLLKAQVMILDLERAIGVWCDSVRATAELRHELNTADEILWADEDYSAALNAVAEVAAAKEKLAATSKAFSDAEMASENIAEGWVKP